MATSTVFCTGCGAGNPTRARFCFACGETVAPEKKSAGTPEQTGQLKIGEVLKQRYQIKGQIGQGGFGAVYKAEDKELGQRLVAVKEMSYQQRSSQEIQDGIETFKREALMLANLKHEHLPRIYEHFNENERWYLVMDYIEGETLKNRFEKSRDGSLPQIMALQISLQLCEVLEYLHTRQPPIVFRDLEPSNIILTPEGNLFLIDFGIARHFKPGQAKDTIAFGSPGYAAPEQYGKTQTTPRADIYSLGSILHQMLSGHDPSLSPFRYTPLSHHHPLLQKLVPRMLDMDENARPANVGEVKQILQTIKDQPAPPIIKAGIPMQVNHFMPGMGGKPAARNLPAIPQPPSFAGLQSMPQATPVQVHQHHYGMVRSVAWSPDSMYVASATDAIVRVWDARSGQNICSYQEHHGNIKHMTWAPQGTRIASISDENKVRIWDGQTGQTIFVYPGVVGITNTLTWSPDGRLLAVAGGRHISIWDTNISMETKKLRRNLTNFSALSWASNGKYLAAATGNKIFLWMPDEEKKSKVRIYHYGTHINAVAWSPNGVYLAVGGSDRTIYIWNAHSERLVGSYRYHAQAVSAIAWAPDSRHVVSAGFHEHINIWDALNGFNIASYYAHSGLTMAVAWSPDGKFLLSGGSDRRVCVWRAP